MSRTGIKSLFEAGGARVRKLNADLLRMDFIKLCARRNSHAAMMMAPDETEFVNRMLEEYGDETVPDIFPGDANICTSLRRKYQARLEGGRS